MRSATGHPDRDLTSLVIVTMWLYALVPAVLQVTLGVRPSTNVGDEATALPIAAASQVLLKYAIFGAVALAAFQALARKRLHVPRAVWLYIGPAVAVTISAAVVTPEHLGPSALLYIFVGLTVAAHEDRPRLMRLLGQLTGLTGLLSICMALAGFGLYAGGDAKGGVLGDNLLAGPTYHPNTLGLMLALGLPWVFAFGPGPRRLVFIVATSLALLWTGSRTSLIAVAVGVTVVLAWRAVPRDRLAYAFAPALLLLTYVSVIPVGAYLTLTSERGQFSGRPYIWGGTRTLIEAQPGLGWGPNAFRDASERAFLGFGDFAPLAFHAHSLLLQQLVTAGIVGLAALLFLAVRILHKSWTAGRRGASSGVIAWPLAYLVAGWLEVPAGFYDANALAWLVWPALAACVVGLAPLGGGESRLDARRASASLTPP